MADQFRNKTRKLIKEGEGSIAHMYLDGEGNVTVAVGNLLSDVASAQALPFVDQDTGDPASAEEVKEDFEKVAAAEPNFVAGHYAQYCKLILTNSEINLLLDVRIDEFEVGLRRDFEDYDQYPESARLGLIDMAFNLGNRGLTQSFPTFTKAARNKNWEICAEECRRYQVQETRNDEVKRLFMECCEHEQIEGVDQD